METIYYVCAIVGGTIVVCQFLLSTVGIGGHDGGDGHDFHVDHDVHSETGGHHHEHGDDHDSSWLVGVLSFRTIVAALTFFGLTGLAASASEMDPYSTFGVALAAGAGALFMVAWTMKLLYRLKHEGTARIERAVGKSGTVYLRIPASKAGVGKVHLNLQNRTMEYRAMTQDRELATGSKVVVVSIISPDTVEVISATE